MRTSSPLLLVKEAGLFLDQALELVNKNPDIDFVRSTKIVTALKGVRDKANRVWVAVEGLADIDTLGKDQ